MPSFDIVSEVDSHELDNAIDQVKRELTNRFDFRNIETETHREENAVILQAPETFQVKQIYEILVNKIIKRGIDVKSLDPQDIETTLAKAKQCVRIKQGIDRDAAKKLVQMIKNSKLKVQASIQGDQVRVTGKKRDDLQAVIALLKDNDFPQALQFENFRD